MARVIPCVARRGRVVPWSNQSTGRAQAAFLEPHDCVVSKLVACREKDFARLVFHHHTVKS